MFNEKLIKQQLHNLAVQKHFRRINTTCEDEPTINAEPEPAGPCRLFIPAAVEPNGLNWRIEKPVVSREQWDKAWAEYDTVHQTLVAEMARAAFAKEVLDRHLMQGLPQHKEQDESDDWKIEPGETDLFAGLFHHVWDAPSLNRAKCMFIGYNPYQAPEIEPGHVVVFRKDDLGYMVYDQMPVQVVYEEIGDFTDFEAARKFLEQ